MSHYIFDSHRGWVRRGGFTGSLPSYARCDRKPVKKEVPIEKEDFFKLLDAARKGCVKSRAELAARGQNMYRA